MNAIECLAIVCAAWLAMTSGAAKGAELSRVEIQTPSPLNSSVPFYYRVPAARGTNDPRGVLLIVPGCNGDGRAMLDEASWKKFADCEQLVLVGPTFQTDLKEIQSRQGYYYPELWSGEATLRAVEEISKRTRAPSDQVLLFGFSAGAHFAHRFANWQPRRVRAFVAYAAGWWDEPSPKLATVPALIMCGEEDPRFEATRAFLLRGHALGLSWVWRGYRGTGHAMTPAVRRMAQAFTAHYARPAPASAVVRYVGDMQSYEAFPEISEQARAVPDELRVLLPDKAVADVWIREK